MAIYPVCPCVREHALCICIYRLIVYILGAQRGSHEDHAGTSGPKDIMYPFVSQACTMHLPHGPSNL